MNLRFRSVLLAAALAAVVPFAFLQNALAQNQPGLPPEKVTAVFGQNIHYYEAGQGPVVILLHGLGSVKEIWMANFGALAPKYHVYTIDQIGFGHSDKPLLEYKIATFVDFLQGFMQAQNIGKATLVGNSLGGWIALDFTIQHPAMVEKLVLVDSAGLASMRPPAVDLNASSLAGMRAILESVFYNKQMVTDQTVLQVFTDHVRNNDAYTIQRMLAGLVTPQFEDTKLASIRVPTLVVWGRQDELIPVAGGEKLRDGIAGAKLVVFDQCGHVPQLEKAAEFNQALLEFLGK
ncbi:MAG: alpha/beta fold hydrolase [Candidatus Sulfotelmatobacter sp.]